MTNELESLKLSFEQLGMTPEEIAEDRGLDIAAVKAGLMQCSSKYRKACGQEPEAADELNFSDDDLRRVNEVIKEVALTSEDDNLRLKAAMYIRDDKKGRKEVVKGVRDVQTNILQFNTLIKQVRESSDKITKELMGGNGGSCVEV